MNKRRIAEINSRIQFRFTTYGFLVLNVTHEELVDALKTAEKYAPRETIKEKIQRWIGVKP